MSNNVDPELLKRLMSVHSEQELMQLLAEHPELTPVLEQMMDEQTVMMKAIEAFVNAETWAESKQVVEANPELLSDEADALLAQLIEAQEDERAVHILEEHRQLLARCRVEGTDAAFGDRVRGRDVVPEVAHRVTAGLPIEVPSRFQEHFTRLQAVPNTTEGFEQQIAICKDILRVLRRHETPAFWGAVQNWLGVAYVYRIRGDRAENLEQAISAFTAALEVRTRADLPVDWAMTKVGLGAAYSARIRGDRAENLEQAIAACTAALEVYTRDDFPVQWASTQHNLGEAYRNRIRGDRAENLEQAISAFTAALEVRTRADLPVDWAMTKVGLGAAYADRIRGDRAENLEQAIAACTAALEVYTRDDFPVQWAGTQNNLGAAYADRIRGDRAENLEQAIQAYTAALEVYMRADFPVQWAMTKVGLGIAYSARIRGDRAENLEQAIQAYTAALEVFTQADFPMQWATTQNGLGNAWRERIRGNRAENMERAIVAFTVALKVFTQADFPVRWATTQTNLGAAYISRIRGDRAENLERAIAAYTAALEVYTRADFPLDWAMTQHNLGAAYRNRIRGDRAENLERAIAAYTAALEVHSQADFPVLWASTQHNLGAAYLYRIRGDRAENLERAIAACQAALEVRTRTDFPADWAMTKVGLGEAYRNRIRGDRAENLERAIAAYTAALEVYTRADFPVDWANTQNSLGEAYRNRIRGDRAENLERAISALVAALEVRTRADLPVDWAMTQNNLGAAYADRIRGDRAENLERTISAYTAALEVFTQADFPVRWATTQSNLGIALCDRIRGDRAENLKRAISAFQGSITANHELGIKDEERRAAGNLGHLHYDERQWSQAYTAFETAIAALEAMRAAYFSEEAKTSLAEENALLYAHMTHTCLHLGRPQEALERAEAGKGRLFLDQLGTDAFPPPLLPPTQQSLLKKERDLANELRGLEHAIHTAPDEGRRRQFVAQQGERRAELDQVWAQLESHAPDYVALRRGDPVKYDDLQSLVDGFGTAAALVEFYTLPDKIIVFVLRSGEQEPAVTQVLISQDQMRRHVQNYWREVVQYPRRGDIGQRWQELAGLLLADVLPHLEEAGLVYLVPHGLLHYLPLHALWVDGEYLIDRFPIAYAPSAAVLSRVIQRRVGIEQAANGRKALVLGYTPHEHQRAVFEGEAVQVAEFFGAEAHLGQEATGGLLREKGAQYDTLHLSCHGFFHPTNPLASGLQLADGVLTARDIMGMKLNADLVTLSACQTALSDQQPGDELVGLTRALLYAGASSVLVTLWSVDAVAALELMGDFYSRLRGKDGTKVKTEAVALREAMLEIRKEREHPYYWAPFILVGEWR